MPIEFYTPPPRPLPEIDAEEKASQYRDLKRLREDRPALSDPRVSREAYDNWQRIQAINREGDRKFEVRDQAVLTGRRDGQSMSNQAFLRKLNTMPRRRFFLGGTVARGLVGLNVSRNGSVAFLGAIQWGIAREFDEIRLDRHGLPSGFAYRGWRSALLAIIRQGVATEREICSVFPFPYGVHGLLWRKYLWEHRHHRCFEEERERHRLPGERI